jgi:hypothetical protein
LSGCIGITLTGCGAGLVGIDQGLLAAQLDQAQREMQRPTIEYAPSYESVTVETDLSVPFGAFSGWLMKIGAPSFGSFRTGTSAVPGVVRTELLNGSWSKPGDRRRVTFADGNSALEEIVMDRRPDFLQYEVWNLTNDTGRYITYALSEFELSDSGQGTHIRWTYSFQPKRLARRVLHPLVCSWRISTVPGNRA